MLAYTVLTVPDPRLRQVAKPVERVTDEIATMLDRMVTTMYQEDGIGLAATQVGIALRMIVMDIHDHDHDHDHDHGAGCTGGKVYKMVNPEIIWRSDETVESREGCLSVPEQYADVTRYERIKVQYLDENGASHVLEAEGLLSDCIQHEIDHLDGILFVDHLSSMKRSLLTNKAKKVVAQRLRDRQS